MLMPQVSREADPRHASTQYSGQWILPNSRRCGSRGRRRWPISVGSRPVWGRSGRSSRGCRQYCPDSQSGAAGGADLVQGDGVAEAHALGGEAVELTGCARQGSPLCPSTLAQCWPENSSRRLRLAFHERACCHVRASSVTPAACGGAKRRKRQEFVDDRPRQRLARVHRQSTGQGLIEAAAKMHAGLAALRSVSRRATCKPSASAVERRGRSAEEALHRWLRRRPRSVAVAHSVPEQSTPTRDCPGSGPPPWATRPAGGRSGADRRGAAARGERIAITAASSVA